MIFEILAQKKGASDATFYYDNEFNILKDADGNVFEYPADKRIKQDKEPVTPFDKNSPIKKSKAVKLLKIQLGLSCNYSCDYCSQKFVERAPETNKKDIDGLEITSFDVKDACFMSCRHNKPTQLGFYIEKPATSGGVFHRQQVFLQTTVRELRGWY